MCRPPKIPAYADERTARRSVPATFVGWGSQKGAIKPQKQAKNSCCQARGERIHFEYPVGRFARLDEKKTAPWCNWQHKGFWFLYSRFES